MAVDEMSSDSDGSGNLFTKMEFAVQMSCASCGQAVKRSLEDVPGIKNVYVNLDDEVVIVETCLSSSNIQRRLEDSGRLVVFRGHGGMDTQLSPEHHGAAVVVLKAYNEGSGFGLARLVQTTPTQCVMDATIDGLPEGDYQVSVHEYGDLSRGCESCGDVYTAGGSAVRGDLGTFTVNNTGRAALQTLNKDFRVWDLIGRSIVVHSPQQRLLCGIIARSAGLFQNTKKLCTCDGVTIWDEARHAKSGADSIKSFL